MDLPAGGPPPSDHDRLDSWKQIAAYLGRGVTTVQRWEEEEALPVHRLPHAKKGSVFAYRHELDAWLTSRAQEPASAPPNGTPATPRWRVSMAQMWWGAGGALAALAALTLIAPSTAERAGGARPAVSRLLPRPLANGLEPEISPSLSPDGTRVVYGRWTGKMELLVKPVAGGEGRPIPLTIAPPATRATNPTWSPRGDLIAFLSSEGPDVRGLYVVPPEGGEARRLTRIGGIGLCWSPDGERIGFADRNSTSEPFSIFTVSLKDGRRARLTLPPPASFGDTHCAFSPDGNFLAVSRYATRQESHLHLVPLRSGDGAQSEQLTSDVNGIAGVSWTPDGTAIVFGAAQGLWMVSATDRGERPVLVAGLEASARMPSFSRPAGGRPAALVYQHHTRDVNVWRRPTAGGANGARVTDSTWWDSGPAISPDGTRLAFTSNRTGNNEIWTANIDGSDAKQITFHKGPLVLSPQWSPDGRAIAFSSVVGGNRDIYVINADGSGSERLTTDPSDEGNPTWSRDGRWIYFRSDRTGVGRLWKMPSGGGAAVAVTNGEASEGFESPDGRLLYFVRNATAAGLWAIPTGGGRQETPVIPDVLENFWGVSDRGIVFIPSRLGNADRTFDLRFLDFASRQVTTLLRQPVDHLPIEPGFAVSRDGGTVLWCQTDTDQDDIMIIERWNP